MWIKIKIDERSGKMLRLKLGIKDIEGYGTGDQLIHVNIWTPKTLIVRRKIGIFEGFENFQPNPSKEKRDFENMREFSAASAKIATLIV